MQYEDWTDPETAKTWDADQTTRNPTRVEQLDILLSVLEDEYQAGGAILDVGMGSGIVEEMIFRRIPEAYVVGLDSSEAMVSLARERLEPYRGRYAVVMHDIRDIDNVQLPDRQYTAAISVQVIHNVADEYKRPIFSWLYRVLEPGGLFLLLDRMAVDTPSLFGAYGSLWDRMERVYEDIIGRSDSTVKSP